MDGAECASDSSETRLARHDSPPPARGNHGNALLVVGRRWSSCCCRVQCRCRDVGGQWADLSRIRPSRHAARQSMRRRSRQSAKRRAAKRREDEMLPSSPPSRLLPVGAPGPPQSAQSLAGGNAPNPRIQQGKERLVAEDINQPRDRSGLDNWSKFGAV